MPSSHKVWCKAHHTYDHLLFLHLSVRSEVIEPGGKKVVGLAYPITLIGYYFAIAVDIVVSTIDLYKSCISLDAIYIVVKFAVLIHDSVLDLGIIPED